MAHCLEVLGVDGVITDNPDDAAWSTTALTLHAPTAASQSTKARNGTSAASASPPGIVTAA
jgi:hypothetical protein